MTKDVKSYLIQNDSDEAYYCGNLVGGKPVCDGFRSDAMEMTDEDIEADFPNGLPDGWKKVKP